MNLLHSLVRVGYWNPGWATTAPSSQIQLVWMGNPQPCSGQAGQPGTLCPVLGDLRAPLGTCRQRSAWMEFSFPQRGDLLVMAGLWGSQGCPVSDVLTVFGFWIAPNLGLEVLHGLSQGWQQSEQIPVPGRAGLSTGVSGCPCVCDLPFGTISPHPAELRKPAPLEALAWWVSWFGGCFFLLERMTLTIQLLLLEEIILFLFSYLPLPLSDRFKWQQGSYLKW